MPLKPNSIIKYDDLHWNKDDKKFVVLSEKDLKKLISSCVKCGMTDADEITHVVRWAECVRVGNILLKGLLAGKILVAVPPGTEEPVFSEIVLDEE